MLKTAPAVFAVRKNYQIMVPVEKPSLFWVRVGDKCYYDEQNGILRSNTSVHRVIVPMEELDRAKEYTVCEKVIIERKPYYPTSEELTETVFSFQPVTKTAGIRAYHVADAHSTWEGHVAAAKAFGKIDFLVLNGDLMNLCEASESFNTIYRIAAEITGGSIPIVLSRGNHDMRGLYAERFAEFTPSDDLKTYYTFRLGCVWGIVLDCGENMPDTHEYYAGTVVCHAFRERQTAFILDVIRSKASEYEEDGVKFKLVVCHIPFTCQNFETQIFREWGSLLKEQVKPHLMLSGHLHETHIKKVGENFDRLSQPCLLVVGSDIDIDENRFVGAGLEFGEDHVKIDLTDNKGNTIQSETLAYT